MLNRDILYMKLSIHCILSYNYYGMQLVLPVTVLCNKGRRQNKLDEQYDEAAHCFLFGLSSRRQWFPLPFTGNMYASSTSSRNDSRIQHPISNFFCIAQWHLALALFLVP